MPDDNERSGLLSRVPVPDPTLLTTEALLREVAHLRELLLAQLSGLEYRLDAYQEAHADTHRNRTTEVQDAIEHLTELCAERFAGIQTQLEERDSRVQESTTASKDAIAAALAAQKEAVAKSELATKEQIAAITTQNITNVSALESKIENVKELVAAITTQFGQETGKGTGLDVALTRTFAIASIVVAVVAVAAAIVVGIQ